jgi:catechol 2,3-dioxygenase-like lactoylglutathione lyase family enzyme
MKAKFICPLFVVRDMEVSRKFYENMLGQEVEYDFAIHRMSHFESLTGNSDIIFNSNNAELYFESTELVELRDELVRSGIHFIHDIVDQPWKQQVMRFYDPDGHIIEVGEPLNYTARRLSAEGLSEDQISLTMGVPPESVSIWLSNKAPDNSG